MKNANGYGSVFKLSGNRRKPWAVRVTTGCDDEGKQIRKYLGYYTTRTKANEALVEFNKSGVDIQNYNIKFSDVFEGWSKTKFKTISTSNVNMYNVAYKYSEELHDKDFKDIRTGDLEKQIYNCPAGIGTKKKMKTLYNQLYAYVGKNTLADVKDFAKYVEMPKAKESDEPVKVPFSDEEIAKLWLYEGKIDHVDTILILIYTGWRIGELLNIKKEHVNLEYGYFVGGSKTEAGKNRIIPIHHKIRPLVEKRYYSCTEYLIENSFKKQMKYSNFRREKWDRIMRDLDMDHLPHETKHTTATLLDRFSANKLAIKKILGHSASNVTEKVYIHKDLELLREAIETIKL